MKENIGKQPGGLAEIGLGLEGLIRQGHAR